MSTEAIERIEELITQKHLEIQHLEYAKKVLFKGTPAESLPKATPKPKADKEARLGQIAKSAKAKRAAFTNEERLAIIEECENAPSVKAVLEKHGVSSASLCGWRKSKKAGKL